MIIWALHFHSAVSPAERHTFTPPPTWRSTAGTDEFGSLAASGKLYEFLVENVPEFRNITADTVEDARKIARERAKQAFVSYLFCDPHNPFKCPQSAKPILKLMANRFPNVVKFVEKLKSSDYRNCARALQRREVALMVDGAAANLSRETFVLIVHDSLIFSPRNTEIVDDAVLSAFSGCKRLPQRGFCDYGQQK